MKLSTKYGRLTASEIESIDTEATDSLVNRIIRDSDFWDGCYYSAERTVSEYLSDTGLKRAERYEVEQAVRNIVNDMRATVCKYTYSSKDETK